MPVRIYARTEAVPIDVNIGEGEYLQYLVSTRSEFIRFSLQDERTGEVVLSDAVPAAILAPTTYTRLWPVVGDRPQAESSLMFTVRFLWPHEHCNLQVQHRDALGKWRAAVDVDFESETGNDVLKYPLHVRSV